MTDQSPREQLNSLLSIIMKERECAKALAIDDMLVASQEKEELLHEMSSLENLSKSDQAIAETIRTENRRNAYLFWSALKWIRESMQFFGKQVSPTSYGSNGNIVHNNRGGGLLSGKV